jgi:(1->4)-alpha-D-glucan 1-alpha-D-glucosylmutase
MLAMAQLDDLLLEAEPVNVPGTVDHPNWRRKYSASLQTLDEQHPAWKILSELSIQRSRSKSSSSKP